MGLEVRNNATALNTMKRMNGHQKAFSKTFNHLSSGLRIAEAADDPSGLAMADDMDTKRKVLEAARRNANDGISVLQTMDSASEEVFSILSRQREIAVQSSSEVLEQDQRQYLQNEFSNLQKEITRIAENVHFNDIKLSNGNQSAMNVQVGSHNTSASRIKIELGDLRASSMQASAGVSYTGVDNLANARETLTGITEVMDVLNSHRTRYGAAEGRMQNAIDNLDTYSQSLTSSLSNIEDADVAKETAEMTKYQILTQASTAVLGQAGSMAEGARRLLP
jgi:flagellin